ncbi:lipid IV(A) 3-deoxy-D-manno-octulosonic acid transferase [Candidatus Fukatsuia symbiotica]|uniref:3-deoxy-D-manno-octulosonic acid transferase n=1 Tax=Candidatus Fukatsuia symbiotica TaxID=1878942 RepID=A0A2U8I2Y1_9GAMM|nr:lipid IV(A) 3-deoxy-D-manno-octulosonic acid transferase [Candidatus Fukatsuia symbiotica]AWK13458.1 3-deoxy-D-manno-octulosonic acid transferase [Candidatus Fukatsuia symbiotica]MEA9444354.1 lipid IV(A) 3-deoxy-D-manno-octulosonic acid transferase [Candidatus Fukatsuia symbiotica]
MLLRLYQILFYLIQPLIWLRLLLRSRKAPAYRQRWGERYGFCAGKVAAKGILLHSVSVGETLAAIPLIKALRHHYPDMPITVTTMTPTGSERVKSALNNEVHHVYLPYDLPCAVNRFLNQLNPHLVIIMETELWPTLIHALHRRSIPLVIANARLSARSAARYQKLGHFIRQMLQRITLIAAQHHEDGERLISLGLKRCQLSVTGSLKFDIAITPELATRAATLRSQWASHRPVWIATSTHDGEETLLLAAYRKLLSTHPTLLLILVPRHPERFPTAIELVQKAGLNYMLRSRGEIPSASTQVVIGDTMGELMLLYGIADIAFVGGSLVKHGGHNPLEAAAHSIPILMGSHTFNFKEICAKLTKAKGLITVTDTLSLVQKMNFLLNDKNRLFYHGQQAVDVLYKNQGALQRLLHLLVPYLRPHNH